VQALLTRDDHASGSDRLAEAAEQLGLSDAQIVVNVQGDEPLIDPQHIHDLAQTLPKHPDCVMATLAHPITSEEEWRSPHVVKVVLDASSKASYFSRSSIPHWRDATPNAIPPECAYRHVGLYAYRTGFLKQFPQLAVAPTERLEALEQLRVLWHGYAMAVHVSPHASAAGVDTEADLARVRALLSQP
jgi:3-deoxy-manno-octulosonate cytidylyltransferase (CMP-KDO synthetase)